MISIRDQENYMDDQNLDSDYADDFNDIRHCNFHQIVGRNGNRDEIVRKDSWNSEYWPPSSSTYCLLEDEVLLASYDVRRWPHLLPYSSFRARQAQ